jgi:hypothetical protein
MEHPQSRLNAPGQDTFGLLETKNRFANFCGARAPDGPGPADGHWSCPVPLATNLLFGEGFLRTYDFSPLWRSTIGIDSLFDLAEMAQRDLRFAT